MVSGPNSKAILCTAAKIESLPPKSKVDDQAPVLEVAVLVLRMIDPQWEVTGFQDPGEALAAVKARPPDLVLSDQIMPGRQGSQLLEEVRALAPRTLRIIMSGQVALNRLTLITSAHQYLGKPFNPSTLRDAIERSFAAQERIQNQELQTVIMGLRSIPSLPQAHELLLRELKDDRTASAVVAGLVEEDPGLSLKVLHLANSPLFGRQCPVTSPVEAVMCLGTDMIAAIVLSQSLFRHYQSLNRPEMDSSRVWTHSWETARLAREICRDKELPADTGDEAFLAGLMHEIGRFILIDNFPGPFKAACDTARQTRSPLVAGLRAAFRASPSEIGAFVLQLWGLPDAVVGAIGGLDHPEEDQPNGFTVRTALYLADHIASGKFPPDSFPVEEWKTDYLKCIGCADQIPAWEKLFSRMTGGGTEN
jgi:HD-like signal output (HDOD) protein